MATASTTVSGEARAAVAAAAAPSEDRPASPRAPSLKRPDGLSDSEWAIMKAAKNEDVHKRINDIMGGHTDPTAEEAAVLLEIVVGAERSALLEIVKLRRAVQPKVEAAGAIARSLNDVRMVLFRHAVGR